MKRSTFRNRYREPWMVESRRGEGWEVGFGGRTEPATVGETEWELREQHPAYVCMHERAEKSVKLGGTAGISSPVPTFRDRTFYVPVNQNIFRRRWFSPFSLIFRSGIPEKRTAAALQMVMKDHLRESSLRMKGGGLYQIRAPRTGLVFKED